MVYKEKAMLFKSHNNKQSPPPKNKTAYSNHHGLKGTTLSVIFTDTLHKQPTSTSSGGDWEYESKCNTWDRQKAILDHMAQEEWNTGDLGLRGFGVTPGSVVSPQGQFSGEGGR